MKNQLKTVYKYNQNNIYQGETLIQEDPLNKGSYLKVPYTTEIKPIKFDDKKEFLKFDKDNNKWEKYNLLNKEIYYYNKKDGSLINLSPYTINISSYTNITPPYHTQEDKIYFDNDSKEWKFSKISLETGKVLLQNAKDNKIEEMEESYNKAQKIRIINGVTFDMPIRGELFNITMPQIIAYGKSNEEGNSYIRITDISNIVFTGQLPYDLLEEVYNISYEISIKNNNNKYYFIDQVNKMKTENEVKDYKFEFISNSEINLNKMIDKYIQNSKNKKGVNYLKGRKKQSSDNYIVFEEIKKRN